MEHIVVGFDGTGPSLLALDWVAERAASRPCHVEIVTVGDDDSLAGSAAVKRDALQSVADRAVGADAVVRRVTGGMPAALLRHARTADLLVIGAHRRRPVRSALTRWLPLRIVSRSPVPTVVVPDDWTFSSGSVLLGLDDDASSSAAVRFAATEAEAAGESLTLLHAWQMPIPTSEGPSALLASTSEIKAAHQGLLDEACGVVADAHPNLTLERVLVKDNPSSALVTRARRASIVVVGTHHRGLLQGALVGSVCQDVLWLSDCPVCVVPA